MTIIIIIIITLTTTSTIIIIIIIAVTIVIEISNFVPPINSLVTPQLFIFFVANHISNYSIKND